MTEAIFVNSFVDSFIDKNIFQDTIVNKGIVFKQLETPKGIPDILVISKSDKTKVDKFAKNNQSLFINGNSKIISLLQRNRKGLIVDEIVKLVGLSRPYVIRVLKELIAANFVNEVKDKYKVVATFKIPRIEITTLEFKMTDWKSALRQSLRYRSFSTRVFVVMPEVKKNLLKSQYSVFKKFNVGIAVYNEMSGEINFLFKPSKRRALSDNMYIDLLGRL